VPSATLAGVVAEGMNRPLAALVATVTIVAGCQVGLGSAAPSPSPSVVAVATSRSPVSLSATAPAPSLEHSTFPSPVASPIVPGSPTASLELPHADVDLERYVPAQIGTVGLVRWSLAGPDVPPAGGDMCLFLCGNEPRDFARALGISLDRVTVALAMSERGGIGGVAFRGRDVATARLTAAGAAISGGVVGGGTPVFAITVAGRSATYLERLGRGQYLVPIRDVLVFLYGEAPMTAPGQISPNGRVAPEVVALIDALPR
jgi:hypothetical protein